MRRAAAALAVSCAALLLPGLGTPAQAQDPGGRRSYSIAPGPLSSALTALAAQAGVLFTADARLLQGLASPGLEGTHDLPSAFAALLRGSGLRVVQEGQTFVLARGEPPPPAAAPPAAAQAASSLPPVTVRAWRERERTAPVYLAGDEAVGLTRSELPLRDAPQAITVLTRDFLQDVDAQSMADLLRYVPGVGAAQGEGNRDTPVFRGASSTSSFLVDGLRDDVQYYRDLYNVERVEALRGPNAMMVGHGAVAGLINRVTKEPTWTTVREASAATGSQQERRATLDASQVHGPQLASRLNLLVEDSRSYRDFFSLRRFGVHPVLAWRLDGRARLTAGFEHFQDQRTADRGIPSYGGRPVDTAASTFFGNPDASFTWVRMNAANAQLELPLGSGQLRSRLRVADYDKFFQNVFAGGVRQGVDQLEVALAAHNSRMRRRNTLSQTDFTASFGGGEVRHAVLAGFELGRQAGDNRRASGFFGPGADAATLYVPLAQSVSREPVSFRGTPTDPNSSSQARSAAVYLQDQIRWSSGWEATLGLRYDDFSVDLQDLAAGQRLASRDRLWSPRAALSYRPREQLSLYAGYSVGYAPRAGESLSSLNLGNRALRPEEYVNYEVGAKWQPRPELEATLALYRLDRKNVLVTDELSLEQALVDGQRTRGLELGASGTLRAGWQLMGAYAWQDSRIRVPLSPAMPAGARMPHVPRHSLSLWNRVALGERWAVGLGAEVRGSIFTSTDNRVRLPGYTRIDAAWFYALGPHASLRLAIENLFDRGYYAFAHSNNNILPGSPRALKLRLNAAF